MHSVPSLWFLKVAQSCVAVTFHSLLKSVLVYLWKSWLNLSGKSIRLLQCFAVTLTGFIFKQEHCSVIFGHYCKYIVLALTVRLVVTKPTFIEDLKSYDLVCSCVALTNSL